MNIKLHNKFEIFLNGKTYVAYNTLLNSVFEKIANLEQYTSNIAIGTGLSHKQPTENKLGAYLRTFNCETEEIQSDVSKGPLYIIKTTTINANDDTTFSFSELGLTDSNDYNPQIYNHVLLTDSNGEPISITRNQGDSMQIKVTIYLELTPNTSSLFTSGKNALIEQILGENLNLNDNNLYAIRGENLIKNKQIFRHTPDLKNAKIFTKNFIENSTSFDIEFYTELGEGRTEEVLICFANQVCIRFNTLEQNPLIFETKEIQSESKIIELGEDVKEVSSLVVAQTNEEISDFSLIKYSNKIIDKLENLFDLPFNNSTIKYLAKDESMIAFILDNYIHLYNCSDYEFKKIDTAQLSALNTIKLVMFENIVIQFLNTSPYIKIFKIENNISKEIPVDLSLYNASSYTYDWFDVDANIMNSDNIKVAIILNNSDYTPVILNLNKSNDGRYYDSLTRPQLTSAKKIYTICKNSYAEPAIGFLTDTHAGGTYYLQEEFYDNSSSLKDSNEVQFHLLANTTKLSVSGRTLISQKETEPYIYVYYYPNYTKATTVPQCINHYSSNNGNYLVTKTFDNKFSFYNIHKENSFNDFQNSFSKDEDTENIKDIIFIKNIILILTDTNIHGYALKNSLSRIEGLKYPNETYTASFSKYDVLGTKKLEGVAVHLNFKFN